MRFDFVCKLLLKRWRKRSFINDAHGNCSGNGDEWRKAGVALIEFPGDSIVKFVDVFGKGGVRISVCKA